MAKVKRNPETFSLFWISASWVMSVRGRKKLKKYDFVHFSHGKSHFANTCSTVRNSYSSCIAKSKMEQFAKNEVYVAQQIHENYFSLLYFTSTHQP